MYEDKEVTDLFEILDTLQKNGINITEKIYINTTLGEIQGIDDLISENKWHREYNIQRALEKVTQSAVKIINGEVSTYRVSEEHIEQLKSWGIIQDNEYNRGIFGKKERKKINNVKSQKKRTVDVLIDILTILKENGVDIKNLPKTRKKLSEIKELEHIIEKEELNPSYDIGTKIQLVRAAFKGLKQGKNTTTMNIKAEDFEVLEELGVLGKKETKKSVDNKKAVYKKSDNLKKTKSNKEKVKIKVKRKIKKPKLEKKQKERVTSVAELLNILEILENNIPGITKRLPRSTKCLGEIEELKSVIEKENLPPQYDIGIKISHIIQAAQRRSIGLKTNNAITDDEIEKIKQLGLLDEQKIEKYKRKKEGKQTTLTSNLIEILEVLRKHGIDLTQLPRSSKKIGEIEYLKEIVEQENIDKNYDIGRVIGVAMMSVKKQATGEKTHYPITYLDTIKLVEWGIVKGTDLEKYKEKRTAVQETIFILKKLNQRGIDIKKLMPYETGIGDITEIEGLKQIIEEENIDPKYRIGKKIRSALYAAKETIMEQEQPELKKFRKGYLLEISKQEILDLKELGLLTEKVMEKFRKSQSNKILEIMKKSVAEQVENNASTREELNNLIKESNKEQEVAD